MPSKASTSMVVARVPQHIRQLDPTWKREESY